ncbi:hypothetical protein DL766_005934 [Monosporascus sp. MC13-8B]|uniref:Amidoligase enzyme n=1 Tax=Monosporascus cannonballus TaxID=155416 RepID=A0ABY0HA27_9PEZI|nr:hypothetical protein DL762_003603 [Monosporascus cannonballus]RYP28343.1 hypothetical protein DL766_005934 [Monosporascus sp. MC13-8B]
MTTPSPPEKTFGVEFEFLVHVDLIGLTEKQKAELSRRPRNEHIYLIAKVIKEYLDRLGLGDPVEASNDLRITNNRRSENEDKCTAWVVKRDDSLPDNAASREKCSRVAQALHGHPHVSFNYTCGLHVHVGLGDQVIPLLACQKLYSLLVLGGEEALKPLFRPCRNNNKHCLDIRTHSSLVTPQEDPPDLAGSVLGEGFKHCFPDDDGSGEERAALDKLWRAADIGKFCDLVEGGPGGRLAYWFSHLRYEGQIMGRATIEFRKAEGNLDAPENLDFVHTWPQVCTALVAFAMDAGPPEFERVIRAVRVGAAVEAPGMRLNQFLTTVGLPGDVVSSLVRRAEVLASEQSGAIAATETLAVYPLAVFLPIDRSPVVQPAQLAIQADGVLVLQQSQHGGSGAPPALRDRRVDEPRRDAAAARLWVQEQAPQSHDTVLARAGTETWRVQLPPEARRSRCARRASTAPGIPRWRHRRPAPRPMPGRPSGGTSARPPPRPRVLAEAMHHSQRGDTPGQA